MASKSAHLAPSEAIDAETGEVTEAPSIGHNKPPEDWEALVEEEVLERWRACDAQESDDPIEWAVAIKRLGGLETRAKIALHNATARSREVIDEIKRAYARLGIEQRKSQLRARLRKHVEANGLPDASGAGVTVYFRRGEPSFEIIDEALLPREYMTPDEKKIRASVKAGVEIPGVEAIPGKRTVEVR